MSLETKLSRHRVLVGVALQQVPFITAEAGVPNNSVLEASPATTRVALDDGLVNSTVMDLTAATSCCALGIGLSAFSKRHMQ